MAGIISTVRTPSYDDGHLDAAVAAHFAALDADTLIPPGARVVLKPNLLMKRTPSQATTTHPALVAAVARRLRGMGVSDIVIADSPGGPFIRSALEGIYKATGMAQAAEDTGARLGYELGYKTVACPVPGSLCGSFSVIDAVEQADVIINLPKLKTHAMTMLSGGVKNIFGCIPGLQKPQMHFRFPQSERFCRMLVELAQTVQPQLTIVDAVVSMEGDGPSAGRPRDTGWTFACDNVFALDLALCDFIGLPAQEAGTVAWAWQTGLAPVDPAALRYAGEKPPRQEGFLLPASRKVDFSDSLPLPRALRTAAGAALTRIMAPKPKVLREKCVGCGKCAESCPAGCIHLQDGKAEIHAAKCIRCFCCHEMCPVAAVAIKGSRP